MNRLESAIILIDKVSGLLEKLPQVAENQNDINSDHYIGTVDGWVYDIQELIKIIRLNVVETNDITIYITDGLNKLVNR